MARPPEYTPEIGAEICERIAAGESLRRICAERDHLPARGTVLSWLFTGKEIHAEFVDQYAKARKAQAEGWADEVITLADDRQGDPDHQSRRLRVDTRKWVASKLLPRFADRLDINAKVAVSGIDDLLAATDEGET